MSDVSKLAPHTSRAEKLFEIVDLWGDNLGLVGRCAKGVFRFAKAWERMQATLDTTQTLATVGPRPYFVMYPNEVC